MAGIHQLQQMHPDPDDDEIEDTFKLIFQNTRKRSIIESYHCSGYKKLCIVQWVKQPEYSAASTSSQCIDDQLG